ncbi:MAG: FKBP-type peptidyl-prolyl cis-trans isomerase [Candidatus Binatia bacterium]
MRQTTSLLAAATFALALTSSLTACAQGTKPEEAPAKAAATEEKKETGKVTTTASGLQYEVLTEGSGPKPSATDNVTVHYKGTLTDGTVFDSSYDRGQPATFPLNRVIKGWTEGLQLMSVGSKYRLTIPSDLGYGAAGAGGKIPPNATLVFDVELLKIN